MRTEVIERAIVKAMIAHLEVRGFVPHSVACDEYTNTRTAEAAMDAVFAVDDSTLRFCRAPYRRDADLYGVVLVCGNGIDIISDWSIDGYDEPGEFSAAMDEITDHVTSVFEDHNYAEIVIPPVPAKEAA